jgi:hypothetical protein
MAKKPDWLVAFFGSQRVENLNPEIVDETRNHAIVKIVDMNQKGQYPKVGFILIPKSGRYGVTPHESLFEGVPDMGDLFRMKSRLEKAESK